MTTYTESTRRRRPPRKLHETLHYSFAAVSCLWLLQSSLQECYPCNAFVTYSGVPLRYRKASILEHQMFVPMRQTVTLLHGTVMDPPSSSSSSSSSYSDFLGRENFDYHKDDKRNVNSSDDDNDIDNNNEPQQYYLDSLYSNESSSPSRILSPSATTGGGFFASKIPQTIRLLRRRKIQNDQQHQQQPTRNENKEQPKVVPTNNKENPTHLPTTQKSAKRKTPGRIVQVTDIVQYKKEVVDVQDYELVVVRFYAPWCKACRAIERPFRRLSKDYPTVKFVEVPVTKDNAYLHQGLGIPSLPFAHIYQQQQLLGDATTTPPLPGTSSTTTLVEEMKINKRVFGNFKRTLEDYVAKECPVDYHHGDIVVRYYEHDSNNNEETKNEAS